jgi:hypothetical protein
MLIKNENSSNETPPLSDPQNDFKLSYESIEKAEILNKYFSSIVLRKRSRIRISLLKVESNQTLSSFLIITSLVGMHILAIFKNIDVKSETAPLRSFREEDF